MFADLTKHLNNQVQVVVEENKTKKMKILNIPSISSFVAQPGIVAPSLSATRASPLEQPQYSMPLNYFSWSDKSGSI